MGTEKTKAVNRLKDKEFLVEEALHYCAGREEIYVSVLESALEEGREKLILLEKCFQEQDFERYGIEVHGLKNVAQMIGAARLYESAYSQNTAAKEKNYGALREGHHQLMADYKEALDTIELALAGE